jgi:hypothetical protein
MAIAVLTVYPIALCNSRFSADFAVSGGACTCSRALRLWLTGAGVVRLVSCGSKKTLWQTAT